MYYSTDPGTRLRFITALHELASFLADHPAVPVPSGDTWISLHGVSAEDGGRDQVNHIAKLLDVAITDDTPDGGHYRAIREFGPIIYQAVSITTAYTACYEASHSYDGCVVPDGPPNGSI